MKWFPVAILLCSTPLFTSCARSQTKTDWEKMDLKGIVKSVQVISYERTYGSTEPYAFSDVLYEFNENGYLTQQIDGDQKTLYLYDSLGTKVEEKTIDKDRVIWRKTIDSERQCYFTLRNDQLDTVHCIEYKYDHLGHIAEEKTIDSKGKVTTCFTFKYDASGNVTEKFCWNGQHKPTFKNTFAYDSQNRKTQMVIYDPETDEVLVLERYSYNDQDQLIETKSYNEKLELVYSKKYTYEMRYDEQGNWTKHQMFVNGLRQELYSERLFTYYP